MYNKALKIYEVVYGTGHPDTANIYYHIGLVHKDTEKYEKALEFLKKCLAVREDTYGKDHPKTKVVQVDIAFCVEQTGGCRFFCFDE